MYVLGSTLWQPRPGSGAGRRAATDGAWGAPAELTGVPSLGGQNPSVAALACSSAGNCTAVGTYVDSSGLPQMFAVTETSGFWATAVRTGAFSRIVATQDVPMVLSCVSAGNCTAGFSADDAGGNTQAFVVSQAGGAWGTAIQVPGTASLNIGTGRVTSVSCTAAGNCSAVGNYQAVLEVNQPFVINQRNGTWGTAQPVSIGAIGGTAAQMNAVSCGASGSEAESVARPSSGNCAAACSSAGNCVLGGDYQDSRFFEQAFLVNETGRIWRTAQAVPGITAINTSIAQTQAVSCGPGSPCTAAGIYSGQGASFHAWVIAQAAA